MGPGGGGLGGACTNRGPAVGHSRAVPGFRGPVGGHNAAVARSRPGEQGPTSTCPGQTKKRRREGKKGKSSAVDGETTGGRFGLRVAVGGVGTAPGLMAAEILPRYGGCKLMRSTKGIPEKGKGDEHG